MYVRVDPQRINNIWWIPASYLQSVIRIALYPAAGKLFDSYTPMFSQRQTTQQAKTINICMVPVLGRYMFPFEFYLKFRYTIRHFVLLNCLVYIYLPRTGTMQILIVFACWVVCLWENIGVYESNVLKFQYNIHWMSNKKTYFGNWYHWKSMFSYHDERSILSLYQPMIGFYI
jgi:hypothetical protein